MAKKEAEIHVKVFTYDPLERKPIPVPKAKVLIEDEGFLWDPDLSDGTHQTDNSGLAKVKISYEEDKKDQLNPYFTVTIENEADRKLPSGAASQLELPEEWETRHHIKKRVPKLLEHNASNPLSIYFGLPAHVRVSYGDYHQTGIRNQVALPADTAQVLLKDEDIFFDDTMTGYTANPMEDKRVATGAETYPYFNVGPTAPNVFDHTDTKPRAWIDPPGAPVGNLGGGSFEKAGALAVDHEGFVFMIDKDVIQRFYPDGTWCETIAHSFNSPQGLALDRFRHLYVADTFNDRIVVFRPGWRNNANSTYVHDRDYTNGLLPAAHQLKNPHGLAIVPSPTLEGNEYLAIANTDKQNVLIWRLIVSGGFTRNAYASPSLNIFRSNLAVFGSNGTTAQKFKRPTGIAADRKGNLYICDKTNHKVERWDLNATRTTYSFNRLWQKAGPIAGTGNGEFKEPIAVAVDQNKDMLYVVEEGNQRIQRIDISTGNTALQWQPKVDNAQIAPEGIAIDGRSTLYFSETTTNTIVRNSIFKANGDNPANSDAPLPQGDPWRKRSHNQHMYQPAYLMYHSDGKLWVSDSGNRRILCYQSNKKGEWSLASEPMETHPTGHVNYLKKPVGIALDEANTLFVADSETHIVKSFQGTPYMRHKTFGTNKGSGNNQFDTPLGIAIIKRSEPLLYVADSGNNRIKVHKADTTHVKNITTPVMKKPEDLAVDSKGNLYVADTGNNRILYYDKNDSFVRAITPSETSLAFQAPSGISIDDDDKLIVTDRSRGWVYRMDQAGKVETWWNLENLLRSQQNTNLYPELARMLVFNSPNRAVINDHGVLSVADTGMHRVRQIRTFTDLKLNLFNLGEFQPDIRLHVNMTGKWKGDLGLKLQVGKTNIFDDAHDFVGTTSDDFTQDEYKNRSQLTRKNYSSDAVNVMQVIRKLQRYLKDHTRKDQASHHWGKPNDTHEMGVDLRQSDGSWYMVDVNLGAKGTAGRGADAWDDVVVAHEVGHWIFYRKINIWLAFPGGAHTITQITKQNLAVSEAWAHQMGMLWGNHYSHTDRVRGYAMYDTVSNNQVDTVYKKGSPSRHVVGGLASAAPTFDQPNLPLEVEGYVANALWQLSHALSNPYIAWADAPSYWHHYNAKTTELESSLYVATIWKPLRMFDGWATLSGSEEFLGQILKSLEPAGYRRLAQTIFELNNLIMPSLKITKGTSSTEAGSALDSSQEIKENKSIAMILRLTDIHGDPLKNCNINCNATNNTGFAFVGAAQPHHHGNKPSTGLNQATNNNGIVNLTYKPPVGHAATSPSVTLTISYQPNFDIDASLQPPEKTDNLADTLRKSYLYRLRRALKYWRGNANLGARVSKTITFTVKAAT